MAEVGGAGAGRSTAIVLFTDLVGSTELRARLGEEAAEEVRRKHDSLVTSSIKGNRGRPVKNLGDGVMATFAGASDAVLAAVAIQQAIHRYNRTGLADLGVRIGISAGDVAFDDHDCFGTPVIEASRLCTAARGGEILASDLVRLLAGSGSGHQFTLVGALDLKGLPAPVAACGVVWEPVAVSAVPLPSLLTDLGWVFVGRDAVAAWLAAASTEEPLLLVVDDLQWAAKPTLLLLRHVVRSADPKRTLFVGAYRDTELGHDHPLVDFLADLRREGSAERISLTGLDSRGVTALMEQAAGHNLNDEDLPLARAIHQETAGNPFFVREVIRHLAETGAIRQHDGRWTTSLPVDDVAIAITARHSRSSRWPKSPPRRRGGSTSSSRSVKRSTTVVSRGTGPSCERRLSGQSGWEMPIGWPGPVWPASAWFTGTGPLPSRPSA